MQEAHRSSKRQIERAALLQAARAKYKSNTCTDPTEDARQYSQTAVGGGLIKKAETRCFPTGAEHLEEMSAQGS